MEKKFELIVPTLPGHLHYRAGIGSKGNFDVNANRIDIADLTDEEAEEMGELIKQQFLRQVKARREASLPKGPVMRGYQQDPGGTGHGDISHSDAAPGL